MVIIIKNRPVSVNAETARKTARRAIVAAAARAVCRTPFVEDDLHVKITFYYDRLPDFDTDNISKPICDALQGIVYNNDNQVMERFARRRDINGAYHLKGIAPEIAAAIAEGDEFVCIEISNVGDGVAYL